MFYLARKDDEASAEWRKALDLEPGFAVSHSAIWAAYLQPSEFGKGFGELPSDAQADDDTLKLAAQAGSYAVSGRKTEAERVLARLQFISKRRYVCPYEMATAHAVLGKSDQAMGWLQKAYQERSGCLPDIKTDPRLDSLRTDPRFQELLRRVGFSP